MKKRTILLFSATLMFVLLSITALGYSIPNSTPAPDSQSISSQFLAQVAGFNMSNYHIAISAPSGPNRILNTEVTPHFSTTILAQIHDDKDEGNAAHLTFADGSFWLYQLDALSGTSTPLSGNLGVCGQSFNDSLNLVINVANGYYALFNESSWSDFAQLASTALQTQKLSVEDADFSLRIQNDSTLWAVCYNKIDGQYITPFRSMQISISRNGMVTNLANNMIYHMATANVTVSEDQASAIAEPYIQSFAQQNQQQVVTTNATFSFQIDGNEKRGDRFAIYPQWAIQALYDKPGEYNASSYSVTIWADNGEIVANGPDYFFANASSMNGPSILLLLLVPVLVAMFLLGLGACLHLKPKFKSMPRFSH